jgi:two-component system KDP operon response regulator KdpE
MKIVLIEDDPRIVDVINLTINIRWPQATCKSVSSGKAGINLVTEEDPTIVILDLGLPDIDGLEVLKAIRAFSQVPVIILTVRNEEVDIVQGLELGADEYITKPFHQMEFLARVKCLLRHHYGESDQAPLIAGPFHFFPCKRRLLQNEKEIFLTATEARIFEVLIKNIGRSVATAALSEAIWGEYSLDSERAVRVYIRRLREKLESNPSNPRAIITRPGIGYSLEKPIIS